MTALHHVYKDVAGAALGLLGEATSIASSCGHDFAVCGGWSPVLRNSGSICHPGTRDVDLLFSDGAKSGALKDVIQAFLSRGYLSSAKHEFQVLRLLPVAPGELVFNVDFLHPSEGRGRGDLFMDQVELAIPIDHQQMMVAKSIALPSANIVFSGHRADEVVDCILPDGTPHRQRVPLIDEVGLLVTKSESCCSLKRPRDLFDIYLAIRYPRDPSRFREGLVRLQRDNEEEFRCIAKIEHGLSKWDKERAPAPCFAKAGLEYTSCASHIRRFLSDWGLGTT